MSVTTKAHHGSIVYTLLKVIFATYCAVTIVVTVFHLLAEYQDAKSKMVEKFHTLEAIFAPGISQALWNLDEVQIASHLEGLMASPMVKAVRLESLDNPSSGQNNSNWSRGEVSEQSFPLTALKGETNEANSFFMNKTLEHRFYLLPPVNANSSNPIGVIKLHSERALLLQEIQQSAFYIICGAIVKTLALWFFFLFFGNKLLRKPLKKLTEVVEEINLQAVESANASLTTLEGTNEFRLLEQSFNQMLERLRAENQAKNLLQQKNEAVLDFLDDIVTSMPVALIGLNSDNEVQHWNPAAERLTGIQSKKAFGQNICQILPSLKPLSEDLTNAKTSRSSFKSKTVELKANNQSVYTRLTAYPLKNNLEHSMVVLIEDITESVLAEKTMVESDKVITLAGFSAGMAHDINNPLGIISQSAENLKNTLFGNNNERRGAEQAPVIQKEESTHLLLDAIQTSVTRMADIVDNMLSFSRNTPAELAPHHIEPIITSTIDFLHRDPNIIHMQRFKDIDIDIQIEPNCPRVLSVPNQLQQALFNLLKNAIEAIGTHCSGIQPKIQISVSSNKHGLSLLISDNGPGIPGELKKTLFKPLKSSKGHAGTGLGLFICHTIVTKVHQGKIHVTTSKKGTQFEICLPTEQ